jgi:ArsR family transcriptional regulator, arsenate/arsenite/antimonite-responsive transcriptional repressor
MIDDCQCERVVSANPRIHLSAMSATVTAADPAASRVKGCCIPLPRQLNGRTADRLAATFKAISDPTRVQMLHLLRASAEPICVCDFTATFDLGQPTVSHHLARLRDAGFVESFKKGVWSFYRLRTDMPAGARSALDLIG